MARRSSTPRGSPKARPDLETLLDERQTVTQWLTRLSQGDDGTPDEVRSKVRGDYQTRLAAVSEQLQGYADELRDALSKETDKLAGLSEKEDSADTRLAEAKLRHSVGEYNDDQWNKVNSQIRGELENVRKELKVVAAEVARLEDVLSSIAKTPEAQPALAELEPDSLGDEGELAIVAPADADATTKKRPSGQTEAFNELEFLKKVAPEGSGKRRRSASFKPRDSAALPEPTPEPPEATATASEEIPQMVPEEDDTARKTLKCVECGAMNRPTEWYCESCGAELAAV